MVHTFLEIQTLMVLHHNRGLPGVSIFAIVAIRLICKDNSGKGPVTTAGNGKNSH